MDSMAIDLACAIWESMPGSEPVAKMRPSPFDLVPIRPEGKLKHAPTYWLTHLATSSITSCDTCCPGLRSSASAPGPWPATSTRSSAG